MAIIYGHLETVTTITIAKLKDRLSEILERVEAGEEITVCRRQHPVAVLRPPIDLTASRSWSDVKGWIEDQEFSELQKAAKSLRRAQPRNPFAT